MRRREQELPLLAAMGGAVLWAIGLVLLAVARL
jgi:hypothetical protein